MEHQLARKTKAVPGTNAGWRTASSPVKTQGEPSAVPRSVRDVLRSPGQPLDAATRAFMEPRFGQDFGGVRVHSDAKAAQSAQAVNARAYAVGSDVVFGGGQYAPATAEGKKLLAHELAHVAQSANHAGPSSLQRISVPNDASELDARTASERISDGKSVTLAHRLSNTLVRQEERPRSVAGGVPPGLLTLPPKVSASVATVSWIDAASPAGSHVADPQPAFVLSEADITGGIPFRFSNYLHAWLRSPDSSRVTGYGYYSNSDIYRGPSYLGIASRMYGKTQKTTPITQAGVEGVEFEQQVGARTVSPGVIGRGAGIAVGGLAGGLLAAAIIGGGPIGIGLGILLGGGMGYVAGPAVANRWTNFPPIWTRIKLRLFADGTRSCDVAARSLFPSQSTYCDLALTGDYNALAAEEAAWERSGWDAGNPWGASRPLGNP